MRRYAEPVTVHTVGAGAGGADAGDLSAGPASECAAGEPLAFVWRGRRYAVRVVLAHWRERRAWWCDVLDPAEAGQGHAPAGARIAAAARERHVWRVEAGHRAASPDPRSAGAGVGVFELACDDADPPVWQVLRVAD